jgi:glycosyltransferase involved in cell wall biosynthesis
VPKLLILCEYPTLNGGERSMLAVLAGVCAAGFEPALLGPAQGPLAQQWLARGLEIVPFDVHASIDGRTTQSALREALAGALRRHRPELFHANSLSMGRLSGPVAAESGVPSLAHLRDIVRLSGQAIRDVNGHRRLLAVSEAVRQFHVAAGLDAPKSYVVYNGVDLDLFRPRSASGYLHRELGLPPDALLVGTIGQIGLRKGQDVLLSAAIALARRLPNLHWLVVGERFSDKAESRRFEADLHARSNRELPGRVRFLGRRNDVASLLGELTLLVHPARQEPLGRVLLEAAAAGIAVVATDVGGTSEIFPADCQAALLVPPDDPSPLAAAIERLLENPGLRSQMALEARRRAENAFDVRSAAVRLVAHYRAVL